MLLTIFCVRIRRQVYLQKITEENLQFLHYVFVHLLFVHLLDRFTAPCISEAVLPGASIFQVENGCDRVYAACESTDLVVLYHREIQVSVSKTRTYDSP